MQKPTRAVIVNDSPTMRAALRAALVAGGVEVVAEAADGVEAVALVAKARPSIVLMDVVMPRCDGYEATRKIMAAGPVPIVMVTAAVDPRDERVVFDALAAGALAIAAAPPAPGHPEYAQRCGALVQLLRAMATVRVGQRDPAPPERTRPGPPSPSRRVQAIGLVTSTGGPQALVEILVDLARHPQLPPILVVQHMASGFTDGFVHWLAGRSGYPVVVAQDGAPLEPGTAYVAPEDRHLGVERRHDALSALVSSEPPLGRFRPSGSHLLRSLASVCGPAAVGVVLTGMGDDGAVGALELKRAGGVVVAQDRASSIIYGMPREVVERGAATETLALGHVAGYLVKVSQS